LGSFRTFCSAAEPRLTRPPLPTYPILPKFGFVSHIYRLAGTPAGPNWVRFARLVLQIGFVSHIRPTELALFCAVGSATKLGLFVQRAARRKCTVRSLETWPSPRANSGLSLRSRCLCGEIIASRRRTKSALHWSRQTRTVPDPANSGGCVCRRPYLSYRRLSIPVCCAKITNSAEIPRAGRRQWAIGRGGQKTEDGRPAGPEPGTPRGIQRRVVDSEPWPTQADFGRREPQGM
jgi:hypothetical protein